MSSEGKLTLQQGAKLNAADLENANSYYLTDNDNNVISNTMSFSNVLAANGTFGNLTSDMISAENITTQKLSIGDVILTSSPAAALTISDNTNKQLLSVDSTGNMNISGSLTSSAGAYDVAEDYLTNDSSISVGELVSLDETAAGYVKRTATAYDKNIVGVYSGNPGVRLSQNDDSGLLHIPVALAGRVPVKVSTENGAIRKGDYLTSSSIPGVAMKATIAGQVIGKALDDYEGGGIATVLAYVNVSYADPNNIAANIIMDDNGNLLISNLSSDSVILPEGLQIGTKEVNGTLSDALIAITDSISTQESQISMLISETLNFASQAAVLETKVADLEVDQASTAAKLAQTTATAASLTDRVDSVVATLSDKIEELYASFDNQKTLSELNISSADTLIASDSAEPVDISVQSDSALSTDISAYTVTVRDAFTALGSSYLNDTHVLGSITIGDSLTLANNSINVSGIEVKEGSEPVGGILYLQNSPLANLINLFNGAVIITRNGTITTKGDIVVGGNLQIDGAITIKATAGEDIKTGDALYISAPEVVKKADSTNEDKMVVLGIAANDATYGNKVTVIIGGKAKGFRNLQTGRRYFLGANAAITTDIPVNAVKTVSVGVAFSETELIMQIAGITTTAQSSTTTGDVASTTTTTTTGTVVTNSSTGTSGIQEPNNTNSAETPTPNTTSKIVPTATPAIISDTNTNSASGEAQLN